MRKIRNMLLVVIIIIILITAYNDKEKIINYINSFLNKTTELYHLGIFAKGDLIDEKTINTLEDSGITGEKLVFYIIYYPYYQMLNENEKKLYKQIYANIDNIKTTFIPIIKVTIEEVNRSVEAVYNDHPEFFWLNTNYSYKYTESGECAQIILSFNETANNIEENKQLFNSVVNNIISEANKLNTIYEKEKYVHDKIIELADYDEKANMNQTSYSALVTNRTVCAGYSRAFQYIMIKLEIPTYYVVGYANEDHSWNIVKLDDEYYNVDLTWDDQEMIIYNYFNVSDNIFNETHTRTGLSEFLPLCSGTKYTNFNKVDNNYKDNVYIYSNKDNEGESGTNNYIIELP